MLSALSTLADTLGLPFQNGNLSQLNKAVDDQARFPLLFYVGYGKGPITKGFTGKATLSDTITLLLVAPADLGEPAADTNTRIAELTPVLLRVSQALSKVAEVSNEFYEGFAATADVDRPMCGYKYTLSAKLNNPVSVC